jgi:hypothetical protein
MISVYRTLSNFNIIFTQMKQQTNNLQSTTAQALTAFPENPQRYIFAYTITDIMHILNKSASWYISFVLSGLLAEHAISALIIVFMHVTYISSKKFSGSSTVITMQIYP